MAFDFKKEYKEFYMPKNKPSIVTVPPMNYIAVRGKGDPNAEDSEYKAAIGLLYGIAFTIKMSRKGDPLTYMLYGHVHDTHDEKLVNEFIRITRSTVVTSRNKPEGHSIPCNMINCFCMFSDYIPVTLDDWIRIDAGRRAKLNRQSN